MLVLLDTHAFIWWTLGDASLSNQARGVIVDPTNQIFVSAASAWEISTKHRIGKLPAAAHLVANFAQIALSQGFILLAITALHAIRAGSLQGAHRDPFDRMLAAQALSENMVIVSNDPKPDLFEVNRIW